MMHVAATGAARCADRPPAGSAQYATPPSDRTRKITSSRRRGEQVVYWIRQLRPRWRTGPPSLSSSPCSTASRTSVALCR